MKCECRCQRCQEEVTPTGSENESSKASRNPLKGMLDTLRANPARVIAFVSSAFSTLLVLGVLELSSEQTESIEKLIVAAVMLFGGGAAGEIIRSKVSPVDEERTEFVTRSSKTEKGT